MKAIPGRSKGLGDSIAKITNKLGIDKVAEAVAKLAGAEGCGCDERKKYLNELFPYESLERKFHILENFEFEGKQYYQGDEIVISKKDPLHEYIIEYVRDNIMEEL